MSVIKRKVATGLLKLAELSAKNRVDSASPWMHYQPKESQKIRDYFERKEEK